jgi:GNAT superfamily N-acetyltransferase
MTIEPLDPFRHEGKSFDCGIEALNVFLRRQAAQQSRKNNSRTYVLADSKHPERIIGFYAVTMIALEWPELPENLAKRHRNAGGAALIARLAVDRRHQGKGLGELLLVDALRRVHAASEMVGYPLVFVDAKSGARSFYEAYGFRPLANHPDRLFMTIAEIRRSMDGV